MSRLKRQSPRPPRPPMERVRQALGRIPPLRPPDRPDPDPESSKTWCLVCRKQYCAGHSDEEIEAFQRDLLQRKEKERS